MNKHKKTLLGGLFSVLLGSSCCWISSLLISLGSAAFAGGLAKVIIDAQVGLLVFGSALLLLSTWQYFSRRSQKDK